jgi:hypothetical protein
MKKNSHAQHVRGVEDLLRELGSPYVAVDEARKAIFTNCESGHFDLLVYMEHSENLLATVLPKSRPTPTAKERHDLEEWQKVFGRDFIGVFIHAADEPTIWRLDERPRQAKPLRSVLKHGWAEGDAPAPPRQAAPSGDCLEVPASVPAPDPVPTAEPAPTPEAGPAADTPPAVQAAPIETRAQLSLF